MHPVFYPFALGLWGILPGNYSGITPVVDNVYAIVDDKESVDGFQFLTLDFNLKNGKLKDAALFEPVGQKLRREKGEGTVRDCEGVCYHPDRQTVFVSGEEDQQICEYRLDGYPTGRKLRIPSQMDIDHIASNRGFEALTYDTLTHLFWTTTEYTLPADTLAEAVVPSSTIAVHIQDELPTPALTSEIPITDRYLRLLSFDDNLLPKSSYIYRLDEPSVREGEGVFGVSALLPMGDGRLLVLEREVVVPKQKYRSRTITKLYVVDPAMVHPVSLRTRPADFPEEDVLPKQLLATITTRFSSVRRGLANYEGMCWGPVLEDGRRTILLIADSQKGMGNSLYHLKDYLGVLVLENELFVQ